MTGVHPDPPSKKRKHRDPDTQSVHKNKKEKRHKATAQSLSEDAPLTEKRKQKPSKDKGKSSALDLPSEFCVVNASLVLSIPPVFASDLRAGVEEMLDSMVIRYIPSLQGVLLAHSNIRFLSQTASIRGDCPFAVCNVSFDAIVWGPRVAMKLVGRISLCSPDHISLLVHRTFNVSIPRHHIPQDQWTFEYGPAENDPEFGGGRDQDIGSESKDVVDAELDVDMNNSSGSKPSGEIREAESGGRWVHHLTGSRLGDPDGYVEFTVIGLTVANEMLSLQGSIQPDPFSPEHVPRHGKGSSPPALHQDEASEVEIRDRGDNEVMQEDDGEEDSDEDGFQHLARLTDEAQAAQRAERAKEEAERRDEAKRRKRQKGVGSIDGEAPRHGKRAKRSK